MMSQMESWARCRCGQLVHNNLFCDAGIALIGSEHVPDIEHTNTSADEFVADLIMRTKVLLNCQNCGHITTLIDNEGFMEIKFFMPRKEN
jgi:hypothetical protein